MPGKTLQVSFGSLQQILKGGTSQSVARKSFLLMAARAIKWKGIKKNKCKRSSRMSDNFKQYAGIFLAIKTFIAPS